MRYISYSLWGDNKVYTYGMIENVLLAKELYAGWTVRVHYNDTVPIQIIEWLKTQENVSLIHHEGHTAKASNTFWRFEDLFLKDATVIVRDSDSRVSTREVECVQEWLHSSKDFHIIRDHEDHTVPILAGTLGCRNNCLEYIGVPNGNRNINGCQFQFENGAQFMKRFVASIHSDMDRYMIDQIFLAQFMYPYVISKTFVHASHNAYEPFAVQIPHVNTGFVGEIVTVCPQASALLGDDEDAFVRQPQYN